MKCIYQNDHEKCENKESSHGYCDFHFQKLPKHTFPKPDTCRICFETLDECDIPLQCGHWFHKQCLNKCCLSNCPLCKQENHQCKDNPNVIQNKNLNHLDTYLEQYQSLLPLCIVLIYTTWICIPIYNTHSISIEYIIDIVLKQDIHKHHPLFQLIYNLMYADVISILETNSFEN